VPTIPTAAVAAAAAGDGGADPTPHSGGLTVRSATASWCRRAVNLRVLSDIVITRSAMTPPLL